MLLGARLGVNRIFKITVKTKYRYFFVVKTVREITVLWDLLGFSIRDSGILEPTPYKIKQKIIKQKSLDKTFGRLLLASTLNLCKKK